MKKSLFFLFALSVMVKTSFGQAASVPILSITNITLTNATADNVLKGTYTPLTYNPVSIQSIPDSFVKGIITKTNPDSIKAYFLKMATFYNRNSGNIAPANPAQGITASMDWVNSKFDEFNVASGNRVLVTDMNFTIPNAASTCNVTNHKQTMLVIPGSSTADKSIMVVCGHLDSRGATSCTPAATLAEGMEDNATGVASIMELARVMSKYSYNRTIVFLITTLEEQALGGAGAFARYCVNNSIPVRANINNDQLGTMICLTGASTPGCTVNNSFDTTHIRIFSNQSASKPQAKSWARYIKLAYKDKALPTATVPMTINLMANLDRDSRGGDHMAFDTLGFTAVRLMCANEAGSGGAGARIHTSGDIGGADKNSDGILDSFYVGFNYMQRNAMIDGLALALGAEAQTPPTYTVTNMGNNNIRVVINTTSYPAYRIGVRTSTNDFDSVYTRTGTTTTLLLPVPGSGNKFYISVAGMDAMNVPTFFGTESVVTSSLITLAVNYVSFDAVKKNNRSELSFRLGQPGAGSVFYIERGIDGQHFNTIGNVIGNGGVQYNYTDSFPVIGSINYYRIREVDQMNATSYSSIRTVKYVADDLIQVFPVPSYNTVTVVFTDVLNQKPKTIAMYTDLGQMVYIKNLYGSNGKDVIDVSEFRNGTYVIKIQTEKGVVNKTIQVIR